MLKLLMTGPNGTQRLVMVIEPDNLEALKTGDGLQVDLNEMGIEGAAITVVDVWFSPDPRWVAEQLNSRRITSGEEFSKLLKESQSRPPKERRPDRAPIIMNYPTRADA